MCARVQGTQIATERKKEDESKRGGESQSQGGRASETKREQSAPAHAGAAIDVPLLTMTDPDESPPSFELTRESPHTRLQFHAGLQIRLTSFSRSPSRFSVLKTATLRTR
eukprot:1184363-Rhodomonas_salina.1